MKRNKLEQSIIGFSSPVVINDATYRNVREMRVAIVMATYNGSKFIEEQLSSIQMQSYSDWILYIRDDGSSDDTVQKVLQIELADKRVKLITDELGNQGAIRNFSALMKVAFEENSDYVFFADQDDVWHPDKLKTMLAGMQELELSHGKQKPLLIHCDLTVVDEDLKPIADSFVKFSRLSPTTADLGVLLCQNQVTGCACAINRFLLELAMPVPSIVLMHDWWLALLASASGKIGFIPRQLVLYRQHGRNVLGAVSFSKRLSKLCFSLQAWKDLEITIKRSFEQAKLLNSRIADRQLECHELTINQINTYSQILSTTPFKRVSKLRAYKVGRKSIRTRWIINFLITIMRKNSDVQ